jgi:hypothetical protein
MTVSPNVPIFSNGLRYSFRIAFFSIPFSRIKFTFSFGSPFCSPTSAPESGRPLLGRFRRGAWAEKQLSQFTRPKNSLQLPESEEWDEQHKQEHGQSQNSLQGASPKVSNTLGKGPPVIETNGGFLQDLATGQHDGKQGRLQ